MLSHVRAHWVAENKLHWSLDVVFMEDENRARKGNAQENLAIMRNLVRNVFRKEKTKKCGAK